MNLTITKRKKASDTPKQKKPLQSRLLYYLNPVVMTVIMVIIQIPYVYFNFGETLNAIVKLAVTTGIIFAMQFFFTSLTSQKIAGVAITNILLLTLYISSYIKMFMTSTPILPINLAMLGEMNRISEFLIFPFRFWFVFGIALWTAYFGCYIYLVIKNREFENFRLKKYLLYFLISLVTFSATVYLVAFKGPFKSDFLNYFNCTATSFDVENDYKKNGSVLTFFMNIDDIFIKKPKNYNDNNIVSLQDKYENSSVIAVPEIEKPVNVIAIQAETWWNPTVLPNVELSADPLSPIRDLPVNSFEGKMITPSYGCNTCIPEFEYLTGSSSKLLPDGGYPYEQFVNAPTETIANTYKANGYNTVALHTYDKQFYNRAKPYPLIRFDIFKGDIDFVDPVIKGMYISDDYMADQIISAYEENLPTKKPLFTYAITMQNHGDFLEQRYTEYDIDVKSELLTEEDLTALRDNVQGVYDTALMYRKLVEYFNSKNEPFLIIMYGDHLPFLGENSSVFKKLGFISEEGIAHNPQAFETPYVIWANFDISEYDFLPVAGPQYLGIKTLQLSQLSDVHWTFEFLYKFYQKYPVYHYLKIMNDKGELIDEEQVDSELREEYELVQYEILFGQKTSDLID